MDYIILALLIIIIGMIAIIFIKQKNQDSSDRLLGIVNMMSELDRRIFDELKLLHNELLNSSIHSLNITAERLESGKQSMLERIESTERLYRSSSDALREMLSHQVKSISESINASNRSIDARLLQLQNQIATMTLETEQRLEQIRKTVAGQLLDIRNDNAKQLEQMRKTVDEKLQTTLDERLTKSFGLVSERLEQVNRGIGEMQSLAADVGSLKRVMTGVKTRGNLGEVQLGAIIEDMLSPEQFERNFTVRPNNRVEFAIKLPGDDEAVYLPVDSKFSMEPYERLLIASDAGDKAAMLSASKELFDRIKSFAKDISTKYILPPKTTDFAIIFLPSEGLYAEAVRLGLLDTLRRDYNVTLTGPSTMGALLNSLQIGFRSYIVHKRSGEVWNVLQDVKKEFSTFADALEATQDKLSRASDDLDKLVGTRTRAMKRKLRAISDAGDDVKFIEGSVSANDKA